MNLKELRLSHNLTLKEVSLLVNVPLRTYIRYENDDNYGDAFKRNSIIKIIEDKFEINEEKGILSFNQIQNIVTKVLVKYSDQVQFCYLFGSYAKGYAKENSDIDLLISTELNGFAFVGLIEELRQSLCKKVDLIRLSDLSNNFDLLNEVMKDGKKIYG